MCVVIFSLSFNVYVLVWLYAYECVIYIYVYTLSTHTHIYIHSYICTYTYRKIYKHTQCCSPWGHTELDTTEWLNNNNYMYIYIYIYVYMKVTQSCPTLWDPMDYSSPRSSVHGDSPGKNTRVSYHALLQGIFLTQGSNPGLPHCRWIL